jgi:hypothetical protein
MVLVALAIWLAQPALAAIELNYFTVIANPASVILQWGTLNEFNVQGYEIQYKREDEPEAAYHRIGFLPAKGGESLPAQYRFPVTSGIETGVPYCFRLVELTTDGTPGEKIDRCGYGPSITPIPGAPTSTPTAAPSSAAPTDAFGNPLPQATDAFGNPLPQATDAFGNPLPAPTDASGNPVVQPPPTDAFGSPLPAPTDAFGNPVVQPPPTDAFGSPLPAPTDAFGNPVVQPPPTDAFGSPLPTPDPNAPPTPIVVTPLPPPSEGAATAEVAQASAETTATVDASLPAYVVVTAVPTTAPVAFGPVLTPLPTLTPTPSILQLTTLLTPSTTQNMMLMLLCLTVAGAGGIGLLGLITSVMFMRSRSTQREFYDRSSLPRRRW